MFGKKSDNKIKMPEIRKDVDSSLFLRCPACDNEMTKVFLPELGFNIDICIDGCGGIYFDNREYEQLRTPEKDITSILDLIKDKTYIKVNEVFQRKCPSCHTKMIKMGTGKAKVEIDVCPVCGGKFLDSGELEAIREAYLGIYEKSVIEYALRNPQSFGIICTEVLKNTQLH